MINDDIIPVSRIERAIYLIRGQKVMLDRDLAELSQVETRALNQAVGRNLGRFPDDFMLELTREEILGISQTVTCSSGIKYSKRVRGFTEQGVAMLTSVLRSQRAVDVNIAIMRTFVKLRQMLDSHEKLAAQLAGLEARYDEQFRVVFEVLDELMSPPDAKQDQIGYSVRERRVPYGAATCPQ